MLSSSVPMADDSAHQSPSTRRRRRSGLEGGDEFVAGSETDDDDSRRYVLQHCREGVHDHEEGRPQIKRRRLEVDTVAVGGEAALPSPTPSCEYDSDGTISDIDAADNGGAGALAPEVSFPCPICRRGFKSMKAVCGHRRLHALHRHLRGKKEKTPVAPPISSGWAVTGKRGSIGGRSVSPESEGVVDSMAIVVAEPVIDPMPIAFASRSSSVEPHPPNDDSMAIVLAADNPPNQAIEHPTCSPLFATAHQPAALHAAVAQGQLAAAPLQNLQPAAHQVQRPAPPARDEQGWWLCKEEGCNQRYATHQGLGGHMAGHKNRQNSEAAAAGLGDASCAKPEKLHYCNHCPAVFTKGVQLGGHMRKHYVGKVTPKKRGAGPMVSAGELASALAQSSLPMPPSAMEEVPKVSASDLAALLTLSSLPMPPATMEIAQAPPAVDPTPVVMRIFGVDIVPGPPAATREEVSSAVTETHQSSAVSTNNI